MKYSRSTMGGFFMLCTVRKLLMGARLCWSPDQQNKFSDLFDLFLLS